MMKTGKSVTCIIQQITKTDWKDFLRKTTMKSALIGKESKLFKGL